MTNKKSIGGTQWQCTVCGRVGTVGRCCGLDTRRPLNDAAQQEARFAEARGSASCSDQFTSAYQRFIESMAQYCHCEPACNRPCDGVLAGGLCDGMDWQRDYDYEDA